jgi:hypothetical protein
MSELAAVRCSGCGGTVRIVPGQRLPACVFCGEAALVPTDPPEGIEPPLGAIPFAVDGGAAKSAFEAFAGGSFWYPSDLRSAAIELRGVLLPAWAWSGQVETHWTGLVAGASRSGKRPVAGSDVARFEQILVPASRSLRLRELAALGRYDERALDSFDPERSEVPIELSELTRSAARASAAEEMRRRHEAAIARAHQLLEIRASSVAQDLQGYPVLVPVWIGAYRYGERSYRVLVHGQTARLVGDAPISWWKVAGVVGAVLAAIASVVIAIALLAH